MPTSFGRSGGNSIGKPGKVNEPTVITWRKLPLDTLITPNGPKSPEFTQLMKSAGLNPRSECYGGDTCIA